MNTTIDTHELINMLADHLSASYIFPDKAERAIEVLRQRLSEGAYGGACDADLCALISADLLATCQDRHLRLLWHESAQESADEAELVSTLRRQILLENHGVRRAERLPGNIGLIALTIIPEAASGGPTLAAAMQLIQHTHALIFDLRETRGGSPDGVVFLASYLLPPGEGRLSDFIEGPNGPTRQHWTLSYLPGPRYLDRDVYILTGKATFSGGEALAYDLQALGRGTVIGASTGGGAHPSEVVSLTEHIELRLPVARSLNQITGSNWEGIGVQPDISAPESAALDVAWTKALTKLAEDPELTEAQRLEAREQLASRLRQPGDEDPSSPPSS